MSRRSGVLAVGILLASALALAADVRAGPQPPTGRSTTKWVRTEAQFQAAERALRWSGGKIVLLPHRYERLFVLARSARPLRIVGTRGTRVGRILFYRTQRVTFGRVRIGPVGGDALVDVRRSRRIVLHDLFVSARDTRFSASVLIPNSRGVTIRRSTFTHCGDRARRFANCVGLYRWAHGVVIEDNWFHDCRGCDFVHGRFGSDLTIRRNRFERSLPCRMNRYRCGHQDLVQLFAGRRLHVERNHFGVYRSGGAQLYLTNSVDYATIVNNVFLATDPRVPGYRVRMGIVIGSNASRRLPYYAKVVNNTILSGARRLDGYAGSIRMSSRYGGVPHWKRPIIANNVIALLDTPGRVCNFAQRFLQNVVLHGQACSGNDSVGPAGLDARGHPRALSSVIDGANRHYAPRTDVTGKRRQGWPDIGAIEYRS